VATPRSMDMSVGTTFSGYKITSVLGRGGMSVVYAAEHVRLGRMVALKILSQSLARDETFRERFSRESQLAATLDHPNIIPIYDAGESDGFFYIAMRHVEGCDLGTLIEQEGPLSLGQTLFYIEQVASALDQAHEQDLIHRDVKPANVLIARPSDRAFLTDFGIVKQLSTRGLTKPAYFLGTYEYSAPEQIEGKEIDRRTDLYALGCILYECLSAEPPFKGDTEGSLIHAHLTEPPPRLSVKRPDVPLAVTDIIATAMAKKKEDRYATCGDFVRALRAVALGTTSGPSIAPAPATVHAAAGGLQLAGDGGNPPGGQPPTGGPLPEPSGKSGPRTVTVTGRRIAALALALAIPIAGAILAFVVFSDDDGKTPAAVGTTTSTETTQTTQTTETNPTVKATGLAGIVPRDVFKYCKDATTREGAEETVTCTSTDVTFFPDLELSFYKNSGTLQAAYDGLKEENAVTDDFGRCDGVAWSGEGQWKHDNGKVGGHRFCQFEGNEAVIYWTHERLGQPSHRDMLGIARTNELSNDDLFNWFRFWKERIGKCPQKDCTL
jgi:protein kinase-like protein